MRDLASIKKKLSDLKPDLEARFHVRSIGLFGSVVRADFSPDSDVDILVEFSQPVGIEFIDLADFIEQRLETKVDLVSRRGVKPGYLRFIEPEIVYV